MTALPKGWSISLLENIAYINPRLTLNSASEDSNPEVSFVPMKAVEELTGKVDTSTTRLLKDVRKGYTPFRNGDVLFAKITPCMENGKVAVAHDLVNGLGFGSTEFHIIRPLCRLNSRYIFQYLIQLSFRNSAKHYMTGSAGQKRVSRNYMSQVELPVAPFNEQQRIVAKIEELFSHLDAGVKSLEKAKTLLKQYRQSVLHAAVTGELTKEWREANKNKLEPADKLLKRILKERRKKWEETQLTKMKAKGKTPKDDKWKKKYIGPEPKEHTGKDCLPNLWINTSIGQLFDVFVGATPSRKKQEYWNGNIPWVSSGEVSFCRIKNTKENITKLGFENTSTELHPPGTTLIGMIGEGKTRGQVAMLDIHAAHNQNSAAIQVSKTVVEPWYIYYFLTLKYKENRQLGSGNNQPALNKTRVQRISLFLPPVAEQKQIVAEVERRFSEIDKLEKLVEENLKRAKNLRQSILKHAFSGKLVPQDPNDESASMLLERIKTEREKESAKPKVKAKRKLKKRRSK